MLPDTSILPRIKVMRDSKIGKMTVCNPNGLAKKRSITMYEPIPTIMEIQAPYLFPLLQYSPKTIGQINTDSKPPKENKFNQTNKSGGLSANNKTASPIIVVTIRLVFLICFSVASFLIKFK